MLVRIVSLVASQKALNLTETCKVIDGLTTEASDTLSKASKRRKKRPTSF
jgi:hypothetical protein